MASLIRIGVRRFAAPNNAKLLVTAKTDLKLARAISGKVLRSQEEPPKKPAPWNYKEKSFSLLNYPFDKTSARLDDNSKVIVVEGPLAAGKSKFAKELADELDMLYLPEANLDMVYINSYGFNLKSLDDQLPESCRSYDVKNFLTTPKHQNTASFQIKQYQVKFSQYIDALAHVLSTGQGVVLDRCAFSDFVFTEAMYSQRYISRDARATYYEIRHNTISELVRPHLVIYLDMPVNTVMENIKKRAIPIEKNSPALSAQYLGAMEKAYKQKYLKEISKHSELLIYDWSEGGEVEIVVEDIERITFERPDNDHHKFKDWEQPLEDDWAMLRYKYADDKDFLMAYFNVPMYHVPELIIDGDEQKMLFDVMSTAPGEVYEVGYNKDMGDTGLLFKTKAPHRDTLPLREREWN